MPDPTQTVLSEQEGWNELLGETNDALTETMLRLPYLDDGPWITTYRNFDEVMSVFDVAGKAVLDIGAERCWSTRRMKLQGARFALGLDILRKKYIGLEIADIYLDNDNIHFERLVGDMNNLPLQAEKFDVVFMTATLHHTSDPALAMKQAAATLVKGGTAIIINEPVRSPLVSGNLEGCVEIEHGINENVYTIMEYMRAFKQAQLRPHLLMPASLMHALDNDPQRAAQEIGRFGHRIVNGLWHHKWGKRLLHTPFLNALYLAANMPLVALATKI
jgi:SAM-dependent methyltransferase